MVAGTRNDPYMGFNFVVEIEGVVVGVIRNGMSVAA